MVGWTKSVTQTEPSLPAEVRSVEEGVALLGLCGPGATEDVGTDFQAAGPRRKDQAVQATEDANPSVPLAGLEGEVYRLVRGQAPSHEVYTPGLGLVPRFIPNLGQGNPHLGDPALVVDRYAGLPYGVPRVVLAHVIIKVGVPLRPGGAHTELVAGQPVIVRIDGNGEKVESTPFVPPDELPADLVRVIVVHPGADVDGAVVVEYTDLGVLTGLGPLHRLPLDEPRRWHGRCPGRFIQPAVDRNLAGPLRRFHGGDGRIPGIRLGDNSTGGQGARNNQGEDRPNNRFQKHTCNVSFLRVVLIVSRSFDVCIFRPTRTSPAVLRQDGATKPHRPPGPRREVILYYKCGW